MLKTFPEFSKPTIADRREYEALIRDYPPLADLSFGMLMTWWNILDSLAISILNGNLVISYWLPGDDTSSGLSLVGTNKVDESICNLFDYLRETEQPVRLVHAPELVLSNARHPELYKITEERNYDECVITLSKLFPLMESNKEVRDTIQKSIAKLISRKVEVRSLNPSHAMTRQQLLEAYLRWGKKGTVNDTVGLMHQALPIAIAQSESLGFENVCLFLDGRLQAFLMFQRPHDNEFIIANYIKMNAALPGLFELTAFKFAEWFSAQGVKYANIDSDLGLPILRNMRLSLGPTNFFRKYTIEPAL